MPGLSEDLLASLRANHLEQLEQGNTSEAFFPVETRRLGAVTFDGEEAVFNSDDHLAVVRLDTNKILGIHSPSYSLMKNQTLFSAVDAALDRSQFIKNPASINDTLIQGGKAVRRTMDLEWVNPAVNENLSEPVADNIPDLVRHIWVEDITDAERASLIRNFMMSHLSVHILNSYNATWPVSIEINSRRFQAAHGAFYALTPHRTNTRKKHTSGLNSTVLATTIAAQARTYYHYWSSCETEFTKFTPNYISEICEHISLDHIYIPGIERRFRHLNIGADQLFPGNTAPPIPAYVDYFRCYLLLCFYAQTSEIRSTYTHNRDFIHQRRIQRVRKEL